MPRNNHPSDEARKRIAAELSRINAELDALEIELHTLWIEQRELDLGDEFSDQEDS
jgi:hypothetical protein